MKTQWKLASDDEEEWVGFSDKDNKLPLQQDEDDSDEDLI